MVTATIKQIAVYTGYYVEQARLDGIESGLPISVHQFSDGLMETAHKSTKSGSVRCSGGRAGPSSNIQYQVAVLSQQMHQQFDADQQQGEQPNHIFCKEAEEKASPASK